MPSMRSCGERTGSLLSLEHDANPERCFPTYLCDLISVTGGRPATPKDLAPSGVQVPGHPILPTPPADPCPSHHQMSCEWTGPAPLLPLPGGAGLWCLGALGYLLCFRGSGVSEQPLKCFGLSPLVEFIRIMAFIFMAPGRDTGTVSPPPDQAGAARLLLGGGAHYRCYLRLESDDVHSS